jgi:hypothetical protein
MSHSSSLEIVFHRSARREPTQELKTIVIIRWLRHINNIVGVCANLAITVCDALPVHKIYGNICILLAKDTDGFEFGTLFNKEATAWQQEGSGH